MFNIILTLGGCIFIFYSYVISLAGLRSQRLSWSLYGSSAPHIKNRLPFGIDRILEILGANNDGRLMELFQLYFTRTGRTLEHTFFGQRTIGTIEPMNLRVILEKNPNDYGLGNRGPAFGPLLGDGIFTQDDSAASRRNLKQLLQSGNHSDIVVARIDGVVNTIRDYLKESGPVIDLQPIFLNFGLDVMTEYLVGESAHSLQGADLVHGKSLSKALALAQEYIAWRSRTPDFCWPFHRQEYNEACDTVHTFIDGMISRRLRHDNIQSERGPRPPSVLDSLLRTTRDRLALRDHLVSLLVAGRDTTASLVSWTFYLLVRHPHSFERLRAEIDTICPQGSIPTSQTFRSMTYLNYVLNETLRLYPPVPVNSRTARRVTLLPCGGGPGGTTPITIPEGTVVAYSAYALHRLPHLYGMDAHTFRPERWLNISKDHNKSKHGANYLPFGEGPRSCLGKNLALFQAGFVVVRVIQQFPTMKLPGEKEVNLLGVEAQTTSLVLSIKEGCNVEIGNH